MLLLNKREPMFFNFIFILLNFNCC
jgi:hypothetical protein